MRVDLGTTYSLLYSKQNKLTRTLRGSKFRTWSPSNDVARDSATYAWPVPRGKKGLVTEKRQNNARTFFEDTIEIYFDAFQSLALGLVNAHRPRQNKRKLDIDLISCLGLDVVRAPEFWKLELLRIVVQFSTFLVTPTCFFFCHWPKRTLLAARVWWYQRSTF